MSVVDRPWDCRRRRHSNTQGLPISMHTSRFVEDCPALPLSLEARHWRNCDHSRHSAALEVCARQSTYVRRVGERPPQ